MIQSNKKYNIPQEILYSVSLVAWNLCGNNLQKFAALKPYYTEAFIVEAINAVESAKQLRSYCQTSSARKEARLHLVTAAKAVMANWQLLKRYIIKSFDKDSVDTMLEAAGESFYKRARLNHWTDVRSLVNTANIFIASRLDALMANGNMPAGFQTTFAITGESFISCSKCFFDIKIDKESATKKKIDANNAIYEEVIEMLKDGQQIFRNNTIAQRQFIFKCLVSKYRGDGSASLKGYIVDELNRPVEGVSVLTENEKYGAVTDNKGYYKITRIEAGTYTFNITCPGYSPISQVITFAAGTASKGNFELTNLLKKVA